MDAAWLRACEHTGLAEADLQVGCLQLRLRAAGQAVLARYLSSLGHLRTTATAVDLTVHLWDTAQSTVHRPRAVWQPADFSRQVPNEVDGLSDARFATVYDPTSECLFGLDRETGRAWQHVPDAAQLPYWDRTFPLRMLLHYWLRATPWQLVHAAAVGTAHGALLMPGQNGAGKSTTALRCLLQGMRFAGDDYVLVHSRDRTVHGLYGIAKVEADNLHRVAALGRWVCNPSRLATEKAMIDVAMGMPSLFAAAMPIRAIVTPRVSAHAGPPRLTEVGAATGFKALAPATVMQLRADCGGTFAKLRDLAAGLPVYLLEVGEDATGLAPMLGELLEALPR